MEDFDFREHGRDMYPTLAEGRESCPVRHGEAFGGFWLLYNYDDVTEAALDVEHFTSTKGVVLPNKKLPVPSLPVQSDPPEHTKYRRLVQPFLTYPKIAALESEIREIIVECIDEFVAAGEGDLMSLADRIPPVVLGLVLGVDSERWPAIREVVIRLYAATAAGDEEEQGRANAGLQEILEKEIASRRASPRDDVLSAIVNSPVDGEVVSPEVAYAMAQLLVIAGHETTVYGIGNVLNHVLSRPELHENLLADDALLDRVVEESLRFEAPVFAMARTVVSDVCRAGTDMKADDQVLLSFGAANHDPKVFSDPERFDPERENVRKQVAFGHGRHRCLGEHLARLEMRIALREVLKRMPGLRRSGPEPEITPLGRRGPVELNVEWDVAGRSA